MVGAQSVGIISARIDPSRTLASTLAQGEA